MRGTGAAPVPAIYDTQVTHVRATPLRNKFRYRSYQWLVDLDHLPQLPAVLRPFARFEARDHLGDPGATLRANVEAFLAARGVDLGGGRIWMLANARVLGYVFNPLSVFWCHHANGELACVIAEVHNTYGERHAYLLHTDERGRAEVAKEFYVSPFHPVDGGYRMSLPEPTERLDLTITLHRPDEMPFVAAVRGIARPGTALGLVRAIARCPWATVGVAAKIRWQGARLWLRRLPVARRPPHPIQEAV